VVLGIGLAAVVIAAYLPVLGNGFVNWDDTLYVTANPHVQQGLGAASLRWAFTTFTAGNWHPVTWISHMIDCGIYGPRAAGHHLTSLLLHLANTLLLFFLLDRMTGARLRSAAVAALFGVHPLHVESVAWIAERKDVLSTLLWLLTVAAWLGYVGSKAREARIARATAGFGTRSGPGPRGDAPYVTRGHVTSKSNAGNTGSSAATKRGLPAGAWYGLTLLLFALGLMAKPMLVTLPFTLLLLDVWPLRRTAGARRLVLEKIPLFALSAASIVVTMAAQKAAGALISVAVEPPAMRVANALVSYVAYIWATVLPVGLSALYPHPHVVPPLEQVGGCALLLVSATALALRARRSLPWLTVGWLWYIGTLVPVIGIVQVGDQARADRYTYVPLIGLFVIVAWGLPEILALITGDAGRGQTPAVLADRAGVNSPPSLTVSARRATANRLLAAPVLADRTGANRPPSAPALSDNAGAHRPSWAVLLADRAARALPAAAVLVVLALAGGAWTRAHVWRDSITLWQDGIRKHPDSGRGHQMLGLAFAAAGRDTEALAEYDRAIELMPKFATPNNNRGYVLTRLGRFREAIEGLDRAVALEPGNVEMYYNRGVARAFSGDHAGAVDDFGRAISVQPDYAPAYETRAISFWKLGAFDRAWADVRETRRLGREPAPGFVRALATSSGRSG
jgi:hypothetical protein